MQIEQNGWNEWSKNVLFRLKSHEDKLEAVDSKIVELQIQMATMKKELELKAAERGAIVGGIISLAVSVVSALIIYAILK